MCSYITGLEERRRMREEGGYVHEAVWNTHRTDNHDIHKQRDDDYSLVESDETIVLLKAVDDQVSSDYPDKVEVQCPIYKEVDALFCAVPDVINVDVAG